MPLLTIADLWSFWHFVRKNTFSPAWFCRADPTLFQRTPGEGGGAQENPWSRSALKTGDHRFQKQKWPSPNPHIDKLTHRRGCRGPARRPAPRPGPLQQRRLLGLVQGEAVEHGAKHVWSSRIPTRSHVQSRAVTSSHAQSRPVTRSHAESLCRCLHGVADGRHGPL